ncbi:uncharacterized protein G2W53_014109 [Senna tora]|uniref:SWIM-type domain-containing protein n=1 Tax=Senna tora TaxID=362788 RepID=A0A834U313_9FABA|nr:uncharacterized protein G2W53_014109 [Senna tora]
MLEDSKTNLHSKPKLRHPTQSKLCHHTRGRSNCLEDIVDASKSIDFANPFEALTFSRTQSTNILEALTFSEKAKLESRNYISYMTGDGRFEVENLWKRDVVDLNNQTCTCKVWDLIGIPCGHGVATIYKMRGIPEDYVHLVYRTSTFMNAYTTTIGPVPSEENWPTSNHTKILPPHYKTAPGRPKKARKRATDEP